MKKKIDKVERDGKIAVIHSEGYGVGWFSEHSQEELLFHPKLVELILTDEQKKITPEWLDEHIHVEGFDINNLFIPDSLGIVWVDKGDKFRVEEYDGSESVVIYHPKDFIKA